MRDGIGQIGLCLPSVKNSYRMACFDKPVHNVGTEETGAAEKE